MLLLLICITRDTDTPLNYSRFPTSYRYTLYEYILYDYYIGTITI